MALSVSESLVMVVHREIPLRNCQGRLKGEFSLTSAKEMIIFRRSPIFHAKIPSKEGGLVKAQNSIPLKIRLSPFVVVVSVLTVFELHLSLKVLIIKILIGTFSVSYTHLTLPTKRIV